MSPQTYKPLTATQFMLWSAGSYQHYWATYRYHVAGMDLSKAVFMAQLT
jgi:hypothetical protein